MTGRVPRSHPRYFSLMTREKIAQGFRDGLVHETGLIAHGRGEAFDYLLGEHTIPPAELAEHMAAVALVAARHPVISVNGNVAALAAQECVTLAERIPALLEVNLFHRSKERIHRIISVLQQEGATEVGGFQADARLPGLDHDRALCDKRGIYSADVVLVPLEDGDRCQALRDMGKTVITIDLNPLSRTAKSAHVTIVDNLLRALPQIQSFVKENTNKKADVDQLLSQWDNAANLQKTVAFMSKRLNSLF